MNPSTPATPSVPEEGRDTCPHGHELTPANVIIRRSKGRSFRACRTCKNSAMRAYHQTPAGVAARKRARSIYRGKGGKQALTAVRRAVARGGLVKQPCRSCGATIVEAHHPNGYGPHKLDVVWLCRQHHAREHHAAA